MECLLVNNVCKPRQSVEFTAFFFNGRTLRLLYDLLWAQFTMDLTEIQMHHCSNVPPCVARNPPYREISISSATQDFPSQDREMILTRITIQLLLHEMSACKNQITVVLLTFIDGSANVIVSRFGHFPPFSIRDCMYSSFGAIVAYRGYKKVELIIGKALDLQVLAFREFRRAEKDDRPAFWCKD